MELRRNASGFGAVLAITQNPPYPSDQDAAILLPPITELTQKLSAIQNHGWAVTKPNIGDYGSRTSTATGRWSPNRTARSMSSCPGGPGRSHLGWMQTPPRSDSGAEALRTEQQSPAPVHRQLHSSIVSGQHGRRTGEGAGG